MNVSHAVDTDELYDDSAHFNPKKVSRRWECNIDSLPNVLPSKEEYARYLDDVYEQRIQTIRFLHACIYQDRIHCYIESPCVKRPTGVYRIFFPSDIVNKKVAHKYCYLSMAKKPAVEYIRDMNHPNAIIRQYGTPGPGRSHHNRRRSHSRKQRKPSHSHDHTCICKCPQCGYNHAYTPDLKTSTVTSTDEETDTSPSEIIDPAVQITEIHVNNLTDDASAWQT